jgi:hypothetical protein
MKTLIPPGQEGVVRVVTRIEHTETIGTSGFAGAVPAYIQPPLTVVPPPSTPDMSS